MSRVFRLFSLAALTVSLAACGPSSPGPSRSTQTIPGAAPAPSGASPAALASLPAPYNTGDVDNGHAKFAVCQACHTLIKGAPNIVGPNLYGVYGRKAGSMANFNYSDAMKGAGWTWDAQHLDTWLTSPGKMLPGTKMTFVGLANPQDRIDVIAYLAAASGS